MAKLLAITIKHLDLSIFSNGATQHIYSMAKLFQHLGWNVILVYINETIPKQTNNYMNLTVLTRHQLTTMMDESTSDMSSNIDLCMFFEWFETGNWMKRLQTHFGCRTIIYQPGNLFEVIHEKYMNNEPLDTIINQDYITTDAIDKIWLSPHYATRAPIYDVLFQTNTVIAPYLWDPTFIDTYIEQKNLTMSYQTPNGFTSVAICEPSRDFLKCAFVPLIACCSAIKQDLIQHVSIYDYSNKLQTSIGSVLKSMGCMTKQHRKQFTYTGRKPIPDLLQEHSIIVCHQNDHMLNYVYLEVAYLGFPVIHNSPMCKEIGYYYEGDNLDELLDKIKEVKQYHHLRQNTYRMKALSEIQKYSATNPNVLQKFRELLQDLSLT